MSRPFGLLIIFFIFDLYGKLSIKRIEKKGDTVMENQIPYSPLMAPFNCLKIKYCDLSLRLSEMRYFEGREKKVNLFINLESVLRNITMMPDMEKRLKLEPAFKKIILKEIINIAAHYRGFFRSNNEYDVQIYLYHTSLESTSFSNRKYVPDYRSYYLLKYNENPKYCILSDALKQEIFPLLTKICDYIPSVHYINSTDFSGDLVPYIIGQKSPTRTNIIITNEFSDTLYNTLPNYLCIFFRKSNHKIAKAFTIKETLQLLTGRDEDDINGMMDIYIKYPFYCALLSVMGDKLKSIPDITGLGPKTLEKLLRKALDQGSITAVPKSATTIGELFENEEVRETFIQNFNCISILNMYNFITPAQMNSVLSQISTRIDINSLQKMNHLAFHDGLLLRELLN